MTNPQQNPHPTESPLPDPISSILDELTDPELEEEEFKADFFQGLSGRRKKAAFTLGVVWITIVTLHLVSWGFAVVLVLGVLLSIHALRLMSAPIPPTQSPYPNPPNLPTVSLLVAAKNEEKVIRKLVHQLANLDYPQQLYEFLVINDNSSDATGAILEELKTLYPHMRVLHRDASQAKGGKSGALNQALPLTKGEIIGVFDADATVPSDLLKSVVPLFLEKSIGAVQVRKAISNAKDNFWTRGQAAEMALDSYFQQQRIACGGIGELRGNGQFVRRIALERCGGWNEETITDDLDLTIRLHLDNWDIALLPHPAVGEEGVKTAVALWHQRSRWAEGGYQRYLDYWRFLLSHRLPWRKKLDLFYFFLVQYILPTAVIPDSLMAITHHKYPLIAPLSSLTFVLAFWGTLLGLRRTKLSPSLSLMDWLKIIQESILGMIYLTHWFVVIPVTTGRMSIRQKRLKWVKTVHEGHGEEELEFNPTNG